MTLGLRQYLWAAQAVSLAFTAAAAALDAPATLIIALGLLAAVLASALVLNECSLVPARTLKGVALILLGVPLLVTVPVQGVRLAWAVSDQVMPSEFSLVAWSLALLCFYAAIVSGGRWALLLSALGVLTLGLLFLNLGALACLTVALAASACFYATQATPKAETTPGLALTPS